MVSDRSWVSSPKLLCWSNGAGPAQRQASSRYTSCKTGCLMIQQSAEVTLLSYSELTSCIATPVSSKVDREVRRSRCCKPSGVTLLPTVSSRSCASDNSAVVITCCGWINTRKTAHTGPMLVGGSQRKLLRAAGHRKNNKRVSCSVHPALPASFC